MKIEFDFDKLNLSQKVFSVIGLILAIILYMADKDNLNISIGLILLTAIIVFFLKYQAIRNFLRTVMSFAILFVIFYLANHYIQNKNREKDYLRQQQIILKQRETTERAYLAEEKKEKENAKQIEVNSKSSAIDTTSPNNSRVVVTLKNNGFDAAERIDIKVKYLTKGGYFIKEDSIDDITNGGVLPPRTESTFNKYVALNVPTQPYLVLISADKAKLRDYCYLVSKFKQPIEAKGYPTKYLIQENIWRCDYYSECEEKMSSKKRDYENLASAECVYGNDRIFNLFNNRAASVWYSRVIIESQHGRIVQYVDIIPDQELFPYSDPKLSEAFMKTLNAGAIESLQKYNNAKSAIYSVTPEGKVTIVTNTFD